ncbi:MAG TPA: hypothetical protein VFE12_06015 [Acetobacteraceae bacterium]|jgi:hypothetical protein|nr:hypothetical protein [Acetobacteraceae bacterium]
MAHESPERPILCPSAQPDVPDAKVFGVLTGTEQTGLRVGYLSEAQPVTPDVLAAAGPAAPSEVMRIAAPCMGHGCGHFDGANCKLATRIATMLDPVVRALPRCAIRPTCRWFRQEGPAACFRCPQVVTDSRTASDLQREVAGDGSQLPENALYKPAGEAPS